MKRILLLLAVLCVAAPLWAASPESRKILQEADRAYREAQYQTAQDGYLHLLRNEGATGHLLYNLGNTAFRMNQTGRAILYYEKARLLLPRDADLAYNLGRARDLARDAAPEPASFANAAFFWLGSLTLAEIFWFFAAANVLFWSLMLLRLYVNAEWTHYLLYLFLTVWLLAGASFWMKWHQVNNDDRAVILQAEVGVLAGPDIRDTLLFKLHEGTIVRQERTEEDWSLIRLPDGKRGWMRSEGLGRIVAPS